MYNFHALFTFTKTLFTTILLFETFYTPATACSSRTIPRPRPSTSSSISAPPITTSTTTTTTTTTTPRPNITFPTYKCPAIYDAWYCLNEATCFSVKIGESVMYNCECANGFMGPRCEYKELDGSYLPKRPRPMLEKASIASGATCALLFICFIGLTLYLRYDHQKPKCIDNEDVVDINDEQCLSGSGGGEFDCRYCYESRYCCNFNECNNDTDLLATAEKFNTSALRQYFEIISPFSFTIKRNTKL